MPCTTDAQTPPPPPPPPTAAGPARDGGGGGDIPEEKDDGGGGGRATDRLDGGGFHSIPGAKQRGEERSGTAWRAPKFVYL